MSVDMSKLATENPEAHAYILQLRGEAAENRVKANEEAAARAIAEAKVTSAESQVTELKSKVTEFETNKTVETEADWRKAAAAKHGLTDGQAKRLQGKTADELMADAEAFAKEVKPARPKPPADGSIKDESDGRSVKPSDDDQENEEFTAKLMSLHGISNNDV